MKTLLRTRLDFLFSSIFNFALIAHFDYAVANLAYLFLPFPLLIFCAYQVLNRGKHNHLCTPNVCCNPISEQKGERKLAFLMVRLCSTGFSLKERSVVRYRPGRMQLNFVNDSMSARDHGVSMFFSAKLRIFLKQRKARQGEIIVADFYANLLKDEF